MIEIINIADVGGYLIAAWISFCGLIVHVTGKKTLSKSLLGAGIGVIAIVTALFIYRY